MIRQKFADARSEFATYIVGGSRAQSQVNLFNMLTQVNGDGTFMDKILIENGTYAGSILWQATLGKMVNENWSKWRNDADRTAFANALKAWLSNVAHFESPFNGPAGETLTDKEIGTLSQIIEVLMFFEDISNPI